MIERIAYVRDPETRDPFGVVVLRYENGHFGVGASLCKMDEDKFDKKFGRELASKRAQTCHGENALLLKDIARLDIQNFLKLGGVTFTPTNGTSEDTFERLVRSYETYLDVVTDMIYTLALAKVKSETT